MATAQHAKKSPGSLVGIPIKRSEIFALLGQSRLWLPCEYVRQNSIYLSLRAGIHTPASVLYKKVRSLCCLVMVAGWNCYSLPCHSSRHLFSYFATRG